MAASASEAHPSVAGCQDHQHICMYNMHYSQMRYNACIHSLLAHMLEHYAYSHCCLCIICYNTCIVIFRTYITAYAIPTGMLQHMHTVIVYVTTYAYIPHSHTVIQQIHAFITHMCSQICRYSSLTHMLQHMHYRITPTYAWYPYTR